jgi:hypothetical protein
MARHPNRKNKPATEIPVDEGEQLHAWQRSMGLAPCETPVTAVPLRAKLVHGIFANRIFGAEELALFFAMVEIFREETAFNGSGDLVQLELLCIYCPKIIRAYRYELTVELIGNCIHSKRYCRHRIQAPGITSPIAASNRRMIPCRRATFFQSCRSASTGVRAGWSSACNVA